MRVGPHAERSKRPNMHAYRDQPWAAPIDEHGAFGVDEHRRFQARRGRQGIDGVPASVGGRRALHVLQFLIVDPAIEGRLKGVAPRLLSHVERVRVDTEEQVHEFVADGNQALTSGSGLKRKPP